MFHHQPMRLTTAPQKMGDHNDDQVSPPIALFPIKGAHVKMTISQGGPQGEEALSGRVQSCYFPNIEHIITKEPEPALRRETYSAEVLARLSSTRIQICFAFC